MIRVIAILAMSTIAVIGQEKKAAKAPEPPSIPAELISDYWHAEVQVRDADAARKAAAGKMIQACGAAHEPQLAGGSKIICVPATQPKAKE